MLRGRTLDRVRLRVCVACTVLAAGLSLLPVLASRQPIRPPTAATSAVVPPPSGGPGAGRQPAIGSGPVVVQVSVSHCGEGWVSGTSGSKSFLLHNSDVSEGDVYLVVADSGAVVAEVEDLGPESSASLTVQLGDGNYAFRCVIEDSAAVTGPIVNVSGAASSSQDSPAVLPVSQSDMIAPTKQYEAFVADRLPSLAAAVRTLRSDVASGDVAKARADWLPAHLDYERLGAAYGAFGEADQAINGLPSGLPGGAGDPAFTGFHRLEYGLWHGQSTATLRPIADRLVTDVDGLVAAFPAMQIDPAAVAIRAHEIVENALQFELTGQTDFGSGSDLATVRAELDGTQELVTVLTPLLRSRYPDLDALHQRWVRAVTDVDSQHHGSTWTPVNLLERADRERIDADLAELAEMLAPIAAICAPRRTS